MKLYAETFLFDVVGLSWIIRAITEELVSVPGVCERWVLELEPSTMANDVFLSPWIKVIQWSLSNKATLFAKKLWPH